MMLKVKDKFRKGKRKGGDVSGLLCEDFSKGVEEMVSLLF